MHEPSDPTAAPSAPLHTHPSAGLVEPIRGGDPHASGAIQTRHDTSAMTAFTPPAHAGTSPTATASNENVPGGTSPSAAFDAPAAHEAHEAHEAHDADAAHSGHDKHAGHSVAMFRDKFWISLALTIPPLIWGHMLPNALGFTPPVFVGSHWIPAIFGTALFVYGGEPFLRGAVREIADRQPAMMTLIALAISVAFVFSVAVALGFPAMPLWEELATLITIMLLGHWLEMRSVMQAQGALGELAKLLPTMAVRVRGEGSGETTEDVPIGELRDRDTVLVRPGANVPADGVVLSGSSKVDESLITGESSPVEKAAQAKVIAGTVNGSGSLRVTVTGTGDRTALAGIMRLVADAQKSKSGAQVLADRAAFWLTWIALGSGIITFAAWLLSGASLATAVERLVTVLVIACPHALGLAVPLVLAISTTLGAKNGLLVRDRRGLEDARKLTAVVFDKTGTLTLGQHRVVGMRTTSGLSEDDALRLAAAVERDAEHPVARAIVQSAADRKLDVPAASSFTAIPGRGVRASVSGRSLSVGGPNLLSGLKVVISPELAIFAADAASHGQGVISLVEGEVVLATFAVADAIRPESVEAVKQLRTAGVEVIMMTGDAQAVADAVARDVGITTVLAQVLPDGKAAEIKKLQSQGKHVAMVGDGVNDAPALATANVGIAIGTGTDVAVEAGDIVLVRSDPRDIPRIINLSRATYTKMKQNLWWAAGYNVVAIPLAAGVLAPWGILLTPAVGALLMSVSTIVVALNAQLLRRAKL